VRSTKVSQISESPASAASDAVVVALRGVDKRFANGTQALAPVDLAVRRGEFVSLLGPSGCGKSTLLNLVAGLLTPTHGEIRWWGGPLAASGGAGRRVGFVFQSPTRRGRVRERAPTARSAGCRGRKRARGRRGAGAVGLRDSARHRVNCPVACRCASRSRALVTSPDLLLMDEPFGLRRFAAAARR
jgi:NitT/TauT family transport system ATP-binding protein